MEHAKYVLGNMSAFTSLEVLQCFGGRLFTAAIPSSFFDLQNMKFLNLAFSYLGGTIPSQVGTRLQTCSPRVIKQFFFMEVYHLSWDLLSHLEVLKLGGYSDSRMETGRNVFGPFYPLKMRLLAERSASRSRESLYLQRDLGASFRPRLDHRRLSNWCKFAMLDLSFF